ncbi:hypothetical protein BDR26DRAFT_862067, partial [Obelidium mucronatum]
MSQNQGGPSTGASVWTDEESAPPQTYYDIIGVPKDADADQIRKAYRKAALKCHPDKKGDDPVAAEQFQKLSKAYEVLSDEKKRQIYDRYGANGVEMMDKMPFLDVGMILAMKNMFCMITMLTAVLLLFPVFLSMKIDEKIGWSWPAVFSPSFVVLGIVVLAVLAAPSSDPEDEEEADRKESKSSKILGKAYNAVYAIALLVFDVLIALKLETTISCSWAAVFIPWFLCEASHLGSVIFSLVGRIREGVFVQMPENLDEEQEVAKRPLTAREIILFVFSHLHFPVLRLIQAILLVVKLDKPDSMPWSATFAPVYVFIVLNLISMTLTFLSTLPQMESPAEKRSATVVFGIAFAIMATIFSVFTYLLVRRVSGDDGYPPAAVVLIPVFFIFSILLCCCGCFLPCMMTVGLAASMDEMERGAAGNSSSSAAAGNGERVRVPMGRRIAAPRDKETSKVTLV